VQGLSNCIVDNVFAHLWRQFRLLFFGRTKVGGKDILKRTWRDLSEYISLEVCGLRNLSVGT